MKSLVEVLRATGTSAALTAADTVQAATKTGTEFDLHLRGARLSEADAHRIARSIGDLPGDGALSLRSFSISYNPDVTEAAAIALLLALPPSVTDLGMVGCALGDAVGEVLCDWVGLTPSLRMVCVEGNRFTTPMRRRIRDLRDGRPGLMVVV